MAESRQDPVSDPGNLIVNITHVLALLGVGYFFAQQTNWGRYVGSFLLAYVAFAIIVLVATHLGKRGRSPLEGVTGLFFNRVPMEHGGRLTLPIICVIHDCQTEELKQSIRRDLIPLAIEDNDRIDEDEMNLVDLNNPEDVRAITSKLRASKGVVLIRAGRSDENNDLWRKAEAPVNDWARVRSEFPAVALLVGVASLPEGLDWMTSHIVHKSTISWGMKWILPGLLHRSAARAAAWRARAGMFHKMFWIAIGIAFALSVWAGRNQARFQALRQGLSVTDMQRLVTGFNEFAATQDESGALSITPSSFELLSRVVNAKMDLVSPSLIEQADGLSLWSVFRNSDVDVIGEVIPIDEKPIPPSCFRARRISTDASSRIEKIRSASIVSCAAANNWIVTYQRDQERIQAFRLEADANDMGIDEDDLRDKCEYSIIPDFKWGSVACLPLGDSQGRAVCMTFFEAAAVEQPFVRQSLVEVAWWLGLAEPQIPLPGEALRKECDKTVKTTPISVEAANEDAS